MTDPRGTRLTGRIHFRLSMTRRLVLVVEYAFETVSVSGADAGEPYWVSRWRDATAADLADLVSLGVLPGARAGRLVDFKHVAGVTA